MSPLSHLRILFALVLTLLIGDLPLSQAQNIDELKVGVVKITATMDKQHRIGTGFIVTIEDETAYIVTASHVVEGASLTINFFTNPDKDYGGITRNMQGANTKGLAVIKVQGPLPEGIRSLSLASNFEVKGGETATVIGFRRSPPIQWGVLQGILTGQTGADLIVSGAVANEGNSGGPILVNEKVVGVLTEVSDDIGYAVPASITQIILQGWGVRVEQGSSQVDRVVPPAREKSDGMTVPTPQEITGKDEAPKTKRSEPPSSSQKEQSEVNLAEISRSELFELQGAIENHLALYKSIEIPTRNEPGSTHRIAQFLTIANPIVLPIGNKQMRVSGNVTLGSRSLGWIVALVTKRTTDEYAVSVDLSGLTHQAASLEGCELQLPGETLDLVWNRTVQGFSDLHANFSPVELACPDLTASISRLVIDGNLSKSSNKRGLNNGRIDLSLRGVAVSATNGDGRLEWDALDIHFEMKNINLRERSRRLMDLPKNYWPAKLAFVAFPFDYFATNNGLIFYQYNAESLEAITFKAEVGNMRMFIKETNEKKIVASLKEGAAQIRAGEGTIINYKHQDLSFTGAGIKLPVDLTFDVEFAETTWGKTSELISFLDSKITLTSFLQNLGPITMQASASGARSSAKASGRAWVEIGIDDPSVALTIMSPNPTKFLLEHISDEDLKAFDLKAFEKAVKETVGAISGTQVTGPRVKEHWFDVVANTETQSIKINGYDEEEIEQVFARACERYHCEPVPTN